MIDKFSDIECEQQILGILLESPEKTIDCLCKDNDFYNSLHGEIFKTILNKLEEYGKCTIYDVKSEFKGKKANEAITVDDYLSSLIDNVITSQNLIEYSRVIKEHAYKRRVYNYIMQSVEALKDNGSPEDVISGIIELHAGKELSTVKTEQEVITEIINSLKTKVQCYSTGLAKLDETMEGGLYENYVYGFAGYEKAGKTTLAHTISHNLDCKHLYIALEMDSKQIHQRNIARDLHTNSTQFINNNRDKLIPKLEVYKPKGNTFYLDAPGWEWSEIRTEIIKAQIKNNIKGFVLDYLQIIDDVENPKRGETEEKAMRRVAQQVANLCRQTGLFCIMLAQRNKGGSLFGGNGLRKACDQLYFIEQPEREKTPTDKLNQRWLKMDASRYTLMKDIGTEELPAFFINSYGPHFSQYD